MKKIFTIIISFAGIILLTTMISSYRLPESSQEKSKVKKAIPANVMKIAEKSCIGCHSKDGMKMAKMFLNLPEWDKYSAGRQASKAGKMCKFVTKERMPPKRFRANNPDAVPSKEELKIICDWATSLKEAGK